MQFKFCKDFQTQSIFLWLMNQKRSDVYQHIIAQSITPKRLNQMQKAQLNLFVLKRVLLNSVEIKSVYKKYL